MSFVEEIVEVELLEMMIYLLRLHIWKCLRKHSIIYNK